jgi:hypothetical protein
VLLLVFPVFLGLPLVSSSISVVSETVITDHTHCILLQIFKTLYYFRALPVIFKKHAIYKSSAHPLVTVVSVPRAYR